MKAKGRNGKGGKRQAAVAVNCFSAVPAVITSSSCAEADTPKGYTAFSSLRWGGTG